MHCNFQTLTQDSVIILRSQKNPATPLLVASPWLRLFITVTVEAWVQSQASRSGICHESGSGH